MKIHQKPCDTKFATNANLHSYFLKFYILYFSLWFLISLYGDWWPRSWIFNRLFLSRIL